MYKASQLCILQMFWVFILQNPMKVHTIHIPPVPQNEAERLQVLKGYKLLDTAADPAFDRFTQLASIICETPISLITLLDENRQWFKSNIGLQLSETSREDAFCSYTILEPALLEVEDATKDERFLSNPLVTGEPGIRFYAGYPLVDPKGFALGSLCVIDREPKKLSASQKKSLQLLADELINVLLEKRKNEELEHFEKLFKLSNDLICIAGNDGFFKKLNPVFETLLGWDTEYLLASSFFDLIHPDDKERTRKEIAKLSTGEPTVNFTHRFLCKNGEYRILQWAATPEPGTGYLFAIARDVTEEKEKEERLLVNENKFRSFFEISPVGIAVNRHLDGKFIDGNKALYQMLGYTEEEYRKLTHWDVTPAKYDAEEMKHRESLTKEGRYGPYEKRYIHKNGHEIPVLLNGIKFIGSNGEEQVYSVIQEITDRKNAEQQLIIEKSRLTAFVEHAPAAVAMLDREFRYIAVSNRWLEEYHIEGKNVIGLSHYDVFPNIGEEWKKIHLRCLHGAVEKNDEEIWRPPGWDEDQYLKWEVRPWYLYDGNVGGIMMFTQDVTEVAQRREELQMAKKLAEQGNLAKSEFLASMSHEIRTPLNGVIGFTDLILKTKLDEIQQQYMTIVNQSANTLLSIINDILDFSKIEAGKLELEIEKCDLYEIGSQAADIISYQVKKKNLEMLLNISTELPRFIWTDSVRLKQILINLLSNAAKFTEHGEIELKIEALSETSEKQVRIRFEVRDTGIGIREDKQQKIFQAFSQEDGSVTRKYGGTGLGLTISNKLLALMGSSLQLVSSPGTGSRFFFDLVLDTEKGPLNRWDDISTIKKVLIVDDNENNRTILSQMLLLEAIHADIARNGIEALQILETGKQYDVIMMDYNMPIMDGLETISKIRNNFSVAGKRQKIMLLSSSSDDQQVIRKCEELRVNTRLVKPIKMQDMYRALAGLARDSESYVMAEEDKDVKSFSDPIKVLIAEDGDVNMMLAKIIIKRLAPNATIIEAKNGLEAVTAFGEQAPDIVFMDIQMPEMNGYEATHAIRETEKATHVPIIAITAGTVKGEREKCIASGMDDFISKPIVENSILNVFNKWFTISQQKTTPVKEAGDTDNPINHINFENLKSFLGFDGEAFRGFLELTKTEISKSMADLEEKFRVKDIVALHKAGHKLKGTALSAGLERLSEIAINFDKLRVFDEAHIQSLLSDARAEIKLLLELIDAELKH